MLGNQPRRSIQKKVTKLLVHIFLQSWDLFALLIFYYLMYNISNMMCPYAYLLAGFMWFVRNGGKFVLRSFNFKRLSKSGSVN